MDDRQLVIQAAKLLFSIYSFFVLGILVCNAISRKKTEWIRTFSMFILLIAIFGILALDPTATSVFVASIVAFGIHEIFHATNAHRASPIHWTFQYYAYATALPVPFLFQYCPFSLHLYLVIAIVILFSLPVLRRDYVLALFDIARPLACLIMSLFLSHLVLLRAMPHGIGLAILVVYLTNMADISGYLFGRASRGKRKLCEAISPGKTVSGSAGSLLATLGLSLLFRWQLFPDVPPWYILTAAFDHQCRGAAGRPGPVGVQTRRRHQGLQLPDPGAGGRSGSLRQSRRDGSDALLLRRPRPDASPLKNAMGPHPGRGIRFSACSGGTP